MTNEQTQALGKNLRSQGIDKKKLKALLGRLGTGAAGVAAGAGAAVLFTGMAPKAPETLAGSEYSKPDVTAEPVAAASVSDTMSFDEAFAAARHEAGPNGYFTWHGKVYGTIYQEEQEQMSEDEQKAMYDGIMAKYYGDPAGTAAPPDQPGMQAQVIIIHDAAPHATAVSDEMSFNDAFAVARGEVGPGGVFDWHGQHYNTYTAEEMKAMSDEQKNDFFASVGDHEAQNTGISFNDVDIVNIDEGIGDGQDVAAAGQLLGEDWIRMEDGSMAHVGLFDVNGQVVMKVDSDNDGQYDISLQENADGTFHLESSDGGSADLTEQELYELAEGHDNFTDTDQPPGFGDMQDSGFGPVHHL